MVKIGEIYEMKKYGKLEVIDLVPGRSVGYSRNSKVAKVRFLDTGFERYAKIDEIERGKVRDYYKKTIFGVGYLGDNRKLKFTQREYRLWYKMMDRCYNQESPVYRFYGEKGVTVDPRWHCFVNFLNDLPSLPGYNEFINSRPGEYNLDKDYLQNGVPYENKVYSKDTCCFIDAKFNSRLSTIDTKQRITLTSKYIGVYEQSSGKFEATIEHFGIRYRLGVYTNEDAAATVYNYIAERCCDHPIINIIDNPMDINTALSYRTSIREFIAPPEVDISDLIIPQNKSSKYKGITKRGEHRYEATYKTPVSKDNRIGVFKTEQAALNARNWYDDFYNGGNSYQEPEVFMDVYEWLSYMNHLHKMKSMCTIVEATVDIKPISQYSGVEKRGDMYVASYFKDGHAICMGTFTDEIAGANAANFGNMFYGGGNSHMNNVPYMQAYEWLQYRTYARDYIANGEMCRIVNRG